jgi:hypothetical protein
VVAIFAQGSEINEAADIFLFYGENIPISWIKVSRLKGDPIVKNERDIVLARTMFVSSMHFAEDDGLIFIGSRKGALAVYDLKVQNPKIFPCLVFRHVHGSDCVTSIKSKSEGNKIWSIYTVGRDGIFSTCTLKKDSSLPTNHLELASDGWCIERSHRSRVTKGWLERLYVTKENILIVGFYDKKLFIYNETKKYQPFNEYCGGGHRIWDLQLGANQDFKTINFGYIYREKLYLVKQNTNDNVFYSDTCLQDSYHCLETRAVSFIKFSAYPKLKFIVSAGENGTLTFHSYDQSRNEPLERLSTCRKHTASIRSLSFVGSTNHESINILFSGGCAQELKAWRLEPRFENSQVINVACLELASTPKTSYDLETRIMDVDSCIKGIFH